MRFRDLSFIDDARALEVEAVEGGRRQNEFTLDPTVGGNDEEVPILGRSVDDAEETEEIVRRIDQFLDYARSAYNQRGLNYPFQTAEGGDSLEIVPGHGDVARRSAALSGMIRKGLPVAKEFEEAAFRALQQLIGGWGVCVGAPRRNGRGPESAIRDFRGSLMAWETGDSRLDFARSGDHGADGFIILGRGWGGPIVFFQAKNTNFNLKDPPEEFSRIPEVLQDWFGRRWNQHRAIIPVLAVNSVLTLEMKADIYQARGAAAVHLLDAVDILCAEVTSEDHKCRQNGILVY